MGQIYRADSLPFLESRKRLRRISAVGFLQRSLSLILMSIIQATRTIRLCVGGIQRACNHFRPPQSPSPGGGGGGRGPLQRNVWWLTGVVLATKKYGDPAFSVLSLVTKKGAKTKASGSSLHHRCR